MNDTNLDLQQLDNAKVGKKIIRFLNEDEVNWILFKAGADDPAEGPVKSLLEAYFAFDFGANVLRPNIAGQSGAEDLTMNDDYPNAWDGAGGFIVFIGGASARAYNIPDAGNFLFGAAAARSGAGYLLTVAGAHLNSAANSQGLDTRADQSAIANGYLYQSHLKQVHYATYPLLGLFRSYDRIRPSWFDKNNDNKALYRR